MLVLDENLPAGQRQLLRNRRTRFRVIGEDMAAPGTTDDDLIPVLRKLRQPTFFTLDRDFYRQSRAHANYCLVWLDVWRGEAADYIRRFLRHPLFNTRGRRMGVVARIHAGGVHFWRTPRRSLKSVSWNE